MISQRVPELYYTLRNAMIVPRPITNKIVFICLLLELQMINRRCFHNQGADKAPTRTCRRFQQGEGLIRGLLDCENRLIVCSSIYYLQSSPGVDCSTSAPWPWLSTTTATEAGRLLTLYSVYCGPAKISDGADKNILTPPPQPFTSFFYANTFSNQVEKVWWRLSKYF